MGKGQRAREARAQAKIDNPQIKTAKKKKNSGKKWVTPLVTALVVVLIVGIFALTYLTDNGIILRGKTVMETDNFKVSGTMMQYAAMSTYQNMVSQWGEEIAQYLQFDDMKESAKTALNQYLIYAEAAKEAGVALDDEDFADIDANIDAMEEAAAANGYSTKSYIAMLFGKGVNEKDIRDFYELVLLANKYETQIYDETEAAVTDEEIDEYYKENIDTLAVADVLKYSETLTLDASLSDEEKAAQKAEFLAKFDAMGAAANEEELRSALLTYLTEKATEEGTLDDEEALTPEDQVENALVTLTKSQVTLAEAADWHFELDGDAHVRQAGEVKLFVEDDEAPAEDESEEEASEDETADTAEDTTADTAVDTAEDTASEPEAQAEDTEAETEAETTADDAEEEEPTEVEYTVEVYCVVEAPHADESIVKSTGHILIAFDSYDTEEEAKAKADEVYAEYLAGEQTKERFEELANKYTDDSGVFYDDIAEGEMVEEFEAWVYDEARVYGDTDIVETTYGYHIMFFTGEARWLYESRTNIVSEKTGDIYTEFEEKYTVTVNESAMNAVKG